MKEEKTNVMRLLDRKKIPYKSHVYGDGEALSGTEAARLLGQNPSQVFKTLVTEAGSGQHYVFVIPAARELDLKKAARAVGEKSVSMVKSKELLPLTGYVHGGCSPVGMKKYFRTVMDESVGEWDTFFISGGKIGYQVEITPRDLAGLIPYATADLTAES